MHFTHLFAPVITETKLDRFRRMVTLIFVVVGVLTVAPSLAQAQTTNCVIASNDGKKGFRTDEISGCRINTKTGDATFRFKGKSRSRSYEGRQPFSQQHIEIANYWLKRADKLRFNARYNRAGFDVRAFLQAAARATDGFILVRKKRGGSQAVNLVYITDGVYRSIDFDGNNGAKVPSGFLTTGQ